MKRLALVALVAAALAGCGSDSPYSYSPYGADSSPAAVAAQPACTTVTTTSGYLVYRC